MRITSFLFLAFLSITTANATDLTVTVSNIQAAQGNVFVALHNSSQGFPDGSRMKGYQVPAHTGRVIVVFVDLPPGNYAISTYQDINGNGILDTNYFGVPVEPYGFSREARSIFGPPLFSDASFMIGTQGVSEEIKLK
ncbi:DUF2141 domain-containing protein [Ferrovum myxofaciens]|uniref:DUF2141 domain-containing protein n=1 Tax=Ferrovum myxofaciens TaxID=416213 RepID=A0A9E6SXF0_9PROT|nr:DUF2141 domain-containing protein [Ferrovum myxofaciens]MBU6995924.1 DUF2141 domain-containing protein [Ferrovum myxofaciens]QKE39360.1 MAG: DUF2141 domain-containing protein [Ferrovum myxofaciens]QWY74628.1 MAG: DUF2141 domain-containing protein [Ferrovum myxofaciens]QWY77377.1 MAG: DUF2141 domain-containing protein [Ferrovum myxofaciens]